MGVDTKVIFVTASAGEEVVVGASVLSSASDVWHERLLLAPPEGDEPIRSVEDGVSLFEIESFVGVLTLMSSSPTVPSLLCNVPQNGSISSRLKINRLEAALTLVHKYDCTGLLSMIIHLADSCFLECRIEGRIDKCEIESDRLVPLSQWLTQYHLDYIIRIQELYWQLDESDDDKLRVHESLLTPMHLALLAQALTMGLVWTSTTRFSNGLHYVHGRVDVVDKQPLPTVENGEPVDMREMKSDAKSDAVKSANPHVPAQDSSGRAIRNTSFDAISNVLHIFLEPLVIERHRLTARALHKVMHHLIPRGCLTVAPDHDIIVGPDEKRMQVPRKYARPHLPTDTEAAAAWVAAL